MKNTFYDGDVIVAPVIEKEKPYRNYETEIDVCGEKEQYPSQITTLIVTNEFIIAAEKYLEDAIQTIGNTKETHEFGEKLFAIRSSLMSYQYCATGSKGIIKVPTVRMDTALYNAHFSDKNPVRSESNYEHQTKPNIDGLNLSDSEKALIARTFEQQCRIDEKSIRIKNSLLLKTLIK